MMPSAEGVRRLLFDEDNYYFYSADDQCYQVQGKFISLPDNLWCSHFRAPFTFNIVSPPFTTKSQELNIKLTKKMLLSPDDKKEFRYYGQDDREITGVETENE